MGMAYGCGVHRLFLFFGIAKIEHQLNDEETPAIIGGSFGELVYTSEGPLLDPREEEGHRGREESRGSGEFSEVLTLPANPPVPNLVFYVHDHLGNTRVTYSTALTCASSTQVAYTLEAVLDYYPYGKILREYTNGENERYLTTQHERDKETGVDYRGARFYDSDIARFLSLDPHAVNYPDLSDYVYVGGNPVVFIDPTGRDIGYTLSFNDKNQPIITVTITGKVIDYSNNITFDAVTIANHLNTTTDGRISNKIPDVDISGLTLKDANGKEHTFGEGTEAKVFLDFNFSGVKSITDATPEDHVVAISNFIPKIEGNGVIGHANGITNMRGGKVMHVDADAFLFPMNYGYSVIAHEIVSHSMQLGHNGNKKYLTTPNGVTIYGKRTIDKDWRRLLMALSEPNELISPKNLIYKVNQGENSEERSGVEVPMFKVINEVGKVYEAKNGGANQTQIYNKEKKMQEND